MPLSQQIQMGKYVKKKKNRHLYIETHGSSTLY